MINTTIISSITLRLSRVKRTPVNNHNNHDDIIMVMMNDNVTA